MAEMTRREFLKGAVMAGSAAVLGGFTDFGTAGAMAAAGDLPQYDPLLDGVCDIHMHLAPDVKPRCTDEFTFARQAKAAGYRAVMYKSNEWSCHDRAYLIRQALPDFEVFGSFCMNFTYGDKINVYAAKMAVQTTGKTCRCIWMPTQAAVYHQNCFGQKGAGIPVSENGRLLPDVVKVMEICAENDIIFATGHSAPEESILMAAKAHEMGFKKLVVTHPNTTVWKMTADQIKRCAELGAYIEYCYLGRLWGEGTSMPEYVRQSGEEFLNYVNIVPERSFISTDLGQYGMPNPLDGMRACIKELQQAGLGQRVIDILVRKNPAYLIGLEG